jgi:hypothetical protein
MNDRKIYILQKDLPDYKAGEEFELTIDGYYTAKISCLDGIKGKWPPRYVENNPEWFKLKEEVNRAVIASWFTDNNSFYFTLLNGKDAPLPPYEISRSRLSEIIIAESKGDLYLDLDEYRREEFFTAQELLTSEEKAFHAGRSYKTLHIDSISNSSFLKLDYKDFSDYKNSIK